MASPGALPTFAGSSAAAPSREILEISSDSDSDSSIVEPDSPNPFSSHCRWRTSEFYDQECSRFFDCPSHTVERAVSDDEADPQEASPREQQGHGREDQAEANSGVGRAQASSINTSSSPRGEPLDAGARASGTGNHSGVVIDLTASPAPEDRDVVMSAPPEDDDVVMSYSPDEGDGGVRLEEVIPDVQQQPINSNADSSASTRLPPHEVIDLTGNDTPPPPSPIRQAPDTIPAAPQRHRPSLTRPPGPRPQLERAQPSEISLPRWQPDAEATLCPICRTQFSFFVRKHHCRKCGRVVCNACSPHRITIPYQYIVQQPEQPRLSSQRYPPSYVGGEGSYGDFNNSHIGGGERVRLCNPCVPDPNITPPQPQQSPNPTSPRNHGRSQSNVSIGFGGGPPPPSARFSSYFAPGFSQGQDPLGRHRSITVSLLLHASEAGR
ncbi:FYVE-domain-containing protein [Plectosphaerella plurivora]|uniref:FYVE-domain-containing protein n=1 Tax=Plectosphaerella plurivora TaxID=936078 RepID=A0A9P8VIY6_9PEZI|nr:FYVE-domain-containing protein [Plectosphaerella plurivora]